MSSKKNTKVVEQSKVKAHGDDKIGESRGNLSALKAQFSF